MDLKEVYIMTCENHMKFKFSHFLLLIKYYWNLLMHMYLLMCCLWLLFQVLSSSCNTLCGPISLKYLLSLQEKVTNP